MRHRTRQLKTTVLESLTLAVKMLNRPSPDARTQGVVGGVSFKRYSHEALKLLREAKLTGHLSQGKAILRARGRTRSVA